MIRCNHKNTKYKMVSWATDCRYGHEQGFTTDVLCCADCGKVMPKSAKEDDNDSIKNDKPRNRFSY